MLSKSSGFVFVVNTTGRIIGTDTLELYEAEQAHFIAGCDLVHSLLRIAARLYLLGRRTRIQDEVFSLLSFRFMSSSLMPY